MGDAVNHPFTPTWTKATPTENGFYFFESKAWGRVILQLAGGIFMVETFANGSGRTYRPGPGLWCRIPEPPPLPEGA